MARRHTELFSAVGAGPWFQKCVAHFAGLSHQRDARQPPATTSLRRCPMHRASARPAPQCHMPLATRAIWFPVTHVFPCQLFCSFETECTAIALLSTTSCSHNVLIARPFTLPSPLLCAMSVTQQHRFQLKLEVFLQSHSNVATLPAV